MKNLLVNEFMNNFGEIFLDSLFDCLKMLPFIFLTYIVIEIVERKAKFTRSGKFLTGKLSPVYGSLAGVFPQCGVSVMAAKLYDKGIIAVGTLLAVFISTSDEAFSILISAGRWASLGTLILLKVVIAMAVGLIGNAVFRKRITYTPRSAKTGDGEENFGHEDICAHCHDHVNESESGAKAVLEKYVFIPLMHSLQTFLYVFAVVFVFGLFFGEGGIIGAEAFEKYLASARYYEPLVTAGIGLIPNCASSAVITSAYLSGAISFGSMAGGLCANAGVGLAVLFKSGKKAKRNFFLLASLYLIGVISGYLINGAFALFGVVL